uniref:Tetraspanin Tsp2 n=1 Tax=Kwoniella dejecticola CBS 10117 TaxID=1296121 RepID=A0A1A6AH07_9TREE|nr:uncharacterized protein I303_01173 [Kwoniella dejecticola CBS 10117]OBR89346.1 hypothetical protein I303_01173 [Kwoniella dejecticola CBS 10117]
MSYDNAGLRRRSPNPNSPIPHLDIDIPYSPGLLSPYISTGSQSNHGRNLGLGYNDVLERYQRPSPLLAAQDYPNPTIRLVPSANNDYGPHSPIQGTRHAPKPSRSKSNDEGGSISAESAESLAALKRHRTDPKSYSNSERASRGKYFESTLFPGIDGRDRPVPPLPLDIRKTRGGPPSIISSRSSGSGRYTGESTIGSSSPRTPRETEARPDNQSRPNSVLSSLKSLKNPFAFSRRPPSTAAPSSPALSSRSIISFATSRSSISSTSTLAVPFYPSAFYKDQGEIGKVSNRDISEKLTDKFPAPRHVQDAAKGKRERWTGFKWILLLSVMTVFAYGVAGLIWALLILGRVNPHSDVTMVADPDIVIFLTLASLLCIFTGFIGFTGVLLNSRPILAFYNLLLWPIVLSMCLVGYTSYKRGSLQLERKLNQAWSQFLDDQERLTIQNSLRCCGYYNPLHDATYSTRCYPRTTLPGCKSRWMQFERENLHKFATAAFSVLGFHFLNIVIAVLCSNHVNNTFGKGLTPPAYRLRMADVRANALSVLATLPMAKDRKSSLSRQPAISHKCRPESPYYSRSSSRMSMSSSDSQAMWSDVIHEAGPRGRALREARERGML